MTSKTWGGYAPVKLLSRPIPIGNGKPASPAIGKKKVYPSTQFIRYDSDRLLAEDLYD
ncbi:hypothetical protein [Rossellomorea aquimaris]|uniref:hypothetical protein n=1 Tax=Rossellomorea aquimaris TaxID=189382 RepID=UPI000AA0F4E1|nr:hypothetical protein [Rossellomorea aquimaris]